MPRGLWNFGVGYMRWRTRLTPILLLHRDEYPPFSMDEEAGYPAASFAGEYPEQRNRLTVLLRLIWMIPIAIYACIIGFIAAIVYLMMWLLIIITGSAPAGALQLHGRRSADRHASRSLHAATDRRIPSVQHGLRSAHWPHDLVPILSTSRSSRSSPTETGATCLFRIILAIPAPVPCRAARYCWWRQPFRPRGAMYIGARASDRRRTADRLGVMALHLVVRHRHYGQRATWPLGLCRQCYALARALQCLHLPAARRVPAVSAFEAVATRLASCSTSSRKCATGCTVAFRIIFLIPHVIVLAPLGIAWGSRASSPGWLSCFTGRTQRASTFSLHGRSALVVPRRGLRPAAERRVTLPSSLDLTSVTLDPILRRVLDI